MKTNVYAPFWIIKAALPHLEVLIQVHHRHYFGTGLRPFAENLYDYAQTKAATMNYVKSLAKQLGPKGIRVNGVAPGPIWTPLQVTGGATQGEAEGIWRADAARPTRPAGKNWLRSMSSLPPTMRVMRMGMFRIIRRQRAALVNDEISKRQMSKGRTSYPIRRSSVPGFDALG